MSDDCGPPWAAGATLLLPFGAGAGRRTSFAGGAVWP